MDITAKLRVYVVRRSSHTSLERDFNHNTRARSFPGVFSSACSKTSTCARRRSERDLKRGERNDTCQREPREREERIRRRASGSDVWTERVAFGGAVSPRERNETGSRASHPLVAGRSLSPLDVQSALTDAAAVSRGESVSMCE